VTARQLIEDAGGVVPACAYCDKEHGATYPPGTKVTHGACRRHTKQLLMDLDMTEEEANARIAHIDATTGFKVEGRPPIAGHRPSSMVHHATGAVPTDQAKLGF